MPASLGAVWFGAMGRVFARSDRGGFALGLSDLLEECLDFFFGDVLVAAGV